MRIISGKYRGKKITAPKNLELRPTTDRAKESLFNILLNRYSPDDISVLDLFAGTGNISYEFASRGCTDIHSVEGNSTAAHFIEQTGETLFPGQMTVFHMDAFDYLREVEREYDLIFADPPFDSYGTGKLPAMIFSRKLLKPGGMFILEHSPRENFEEDEHFRTRRKYGHVHFSFFSGSED